MSDSSQSKEVGMTRRGERGFTMIEIVIVIAVIAVITVPTTLFFVNFAQAQALNGAAQQVVNHLNQVRQLAITSSTSYRVDFDVTNGKLRFLRPASCNPNTNGSCTPWTGPGTDGTGWRTLENGARIQCVPSSTVTFNYLGTGTGGTVGLQASAGNDTRYVIVGSTGRVRTATTMTAGSCS